WDGWIYATHGYSASSKVQNAKGEPMGNIGSGVVRFKPDGSKIEQYSSKGGNTWGLTITGDNRVMWTQPTSGQLLMHTILPEYALANGKVGSTASYKVVEPSGKSFPAMTAEQLPYVQIDWVGSFTAAAGAVVYDGGSWPKEYNGDYFTTEPTINVIHHTRLTPEGASYKAARLPGREETEFVRSTDMWWRPIEVRVGPDGAMYVADFYNQAVIHNDTRGPDHNRVNAAVRPDRDHYFGRIWRLDHKSAKTLAVPNLAQLGTDALIDALSSPNANVRLNASRLLVEKAAQLADQERNNVRFNFASTTRGDWNKLSTDAKIARLWTLHRIGAALPAQLTRAALSDSDASVRRNMLLVAEEQRATPAATLPPDAASPVTAALNDADAGVRLAALRALAVGEVNQVDARLLIGAWSKFDDDFQRSAAIGAAARNPVASINAALDSADPAGLAPLVAQLATTISDKNDTAAAGQLVISLASKPAAADPLKRSILDTLAKAKGDAPAMTPELSSALGKLLTSGASGSALPLAAKWDKAGTLQPQIAALATQMTSTLSDTKANDEARFAAASSLLGLRAANPTALATVAKLLGSDASPTLQKWIVVALGETGDPAAGTALVSSFGKLPVDVQQAAFDVLLKRADSSITLLDAIQAKTLDVSGVGPANLARLRTHPDKNVAQRSGAVLDEILGPAMKAKNEAIARLTPAVEKPGNVANGKTLFAATCATCHKFGEIGVNIGPGLTGMGAHGPAELLTAIVDPNREVDPTFVTWNIETNDGQLYSGVIESENPSSITLKSLAGVQEVKVAAIKTRVNTGRSLMPEGFEGLGGEPLRDIIAYMQSESGGGKFRTLDLTKAFTANTARGLYVSDENKGDTLVFAKTGTVTVDGIPFNIVAPERAPANVIVLKGGPERSYSKGRPERVEVPVGGFKANRLHFLGGVAGWGHPFGGEDEVVMRVTAHTTDGIRENFNLKNGVEFADYIREVDVPGSKLTKGLVKGHQLRWFTLRLSQPAEIEKLTLESLNTGVAPTTVAITAELADPNAPAPASTPATAKPANAAPAAEIQIAPEFSQPVPQPPATANGPRVLLVGGGSAHDFPKWFGATDKAILAPHVGWVDFTMNANAVPAVLGNVDLLVWSANQPISATTRKALMEWVNAGKPLILLHPGLWYNWNNFPQWNREVAGGGSRGHDKFGEFEVVASAADHPLMAGVPTNFKIADELYYFAPDPAGTPIQVLATATSTQKPGTYPQVFVVKHPKSRIVGITLGHDAKAHDHPAFQALLKNAVKWTSGK
ncbi:MAG: hypothetical protein JWQ44_1589, partial [Chthoniobacter sp.]|nr:hypothetical protein [Chthoniobacter sp.]